MHLERHSIERVGWLRAAVLGANDGIVSTASLVLGVASANTGSSGVLLAGIAGLVAGAMSMAAGEYVSVSSQADTENAALAQEKRELETDYQGEVRELTLLYVQRGLEPELAQKVAEQLMVKDALDTHAREELGLTDTNSARPLQAGCSPSRVKNCCLWAMSSLKAASGTTTAAARCTYTTTRDG